MSTREHVQAEYPQVMPAVDARVDVRCRAVQRPGHLPKRGEANLSAVP
jgi:hypothetical protein